MWKSSDAGEKTEAKHGKVLLAEDEPSVQMMVKRRLVASGFDVVVAEDGEQVLEKAKQEIFDVIVMDIMMPKMNGDEVANVLRSTGRTAFTPIIFLTCLVKPEEALHAHNVIGGDLIMAKPFDGDKLVELIEKVIKK